MTDPGQDQFRLSRRTVLGRLAIAGLGGVAVSSVFAACDQDSTESAGTGVLATDKTSKPATEATKAANKKLLDTLPFSDKADFGDAERGLIARPDTLTIKDAKGNVVWDMEEFKKYIGDDKPAPDTVNPSLWRNAQLCMQYGLFEVLPDRIYQVRGYDASNITFVKGNTGWIVIDTLFSPETARAGLDLATQHLGARPIVAVIYSHSHTDHYGGVRGIISQADVDLGQGQSHRAGGFHRACGKRRCDRRQRDVAARGVHGRCACSSKRRRRRECRCGTVDFDWCTHAYSPDRHHHRDGHEHDHRRCGHGVPDDAGHRGAVGDEHVLSAVQGDVDGRERHQLDAQPVDSAWSAGARRFENGRRPWTRPSGCTARIREVKFQSHQWPKWRQRQHHRLLEAPA